jgi:hypothetical protein
MTQTLIEKLEALPLWWALVDGKSKLVLDAYAVGKIIEQAKAEKQEPVALVEHVSERYAFCKVAKGKALQSGQMLYANLPTPQPDIVAELVKALEDADELIGIEPYEHVAQESADAHRNIRAILAKAKEMMR